MKPALFALVALGVGIAIGVAVTRREFARDVLPLTSPEPLAGPVAGPGTRGGPKLVVVNGERHNFGTLNRNAPGEHTFIIRNDGDATLVLGTGKATCKCTTFELAKNKLAPGESTEVHLKWEAKTPDVHFEQSAPLILENVADRPTISLVIEGRVIDVVRPERSEIALTDISANEVTHARLKIFGYKGDEIPTPKHAWTSATYGDRFHVRFEPLTEAEIAGEPGAAAGLALLLDIDQGLPLGTLDETLRLTFELTGVEPLDIRLRGNVASDISLAGPGVIPEKLFVSLGTISGETGSKTTVFLLVKGPFRGETELKLASVEPKNELVATLGTPADTSGKVNRYPLVLEIPAGTSPVARASEGAYALVKLTATHPQVKDLTLKIRYIVRE